MSDELAAAFGRALIRAAEIREAARIRKLRAERERRLDALFANVSTEALKAAWDAVGDDFTGHGFDIDDIHAELNRRGEGFYCAV